MIPRGLYATHPALLDNVEVVSIAYGILVMMVGWFLKAAGGSVAVKPKRAAP
jgi:hypothetical protein